MPNSRKHKQDGECGCDHKFDEDKCQDDCACDSDCACEHDHDACCDSAPADPIVSNMQINAFLDDLASDLPAPGGGGATAVVASIGAALSSMHASLTLSNSNYESAHDDACAIKEELDKKQKELLNLSDEDARVFQNFMAAYKLPHENDEQTEIRNEAIQCELLKCANVPFQIMNTICECIDLCLEIAKIGNKMVLSDSACCATILKAALQCAINNVLVNLSSMKDKDLASELSIECQNKLQEYFPKADQVNELFLDSLV